MQLMQQRVFLLRHRGAPDAGQGNWAELEKLVADGWRVANMESLGYTPEEISAGGTNVQGFLYAVVVLERPEAPKPAKPIPPNAFNRG